ncbi:hypothetical protein VNO80_25670 [Phaseolus coccineus]|uniref:Uncharacterized protein n=1 Tax=Phaseolus coccineus TaxID=3886 RepID=A0AAN9LY96_PHACN
MTYPKKTCHLNDPPDVPVMVKPMVGDHIAVPIELVNNLEPTTLDMAQFHLPLALLRDHLLIVPMSPSDPHGVHLIRTSLVLPILSFVDLWPTNAIDSFHAFTITSHSHSSSISTKTLIPTSPFYFDPSLFNPDLCTPGPNLSKVVRSIREKKASWLVEGLLLDFEDFVAGQFCSRAHDILVACKAYMDGAQVGCLAKGGVQYVDLGHKSCSNEFRTYLSSCVDILVTEFTKIGAKDCDKIFPSREEKIPLNETPEAAVIPD